MSGEMASGMVREDNSTSPRGSVTAAKRKRSRVSLACQRCKSRKQKCDGKQPMCQNCSSAGAKCEFIYPDRAWPFGRDKYTKALEDRVAMLENYLSEQGLSETEMDNWLLSHNNGISSKKATAASESQPAASAPAQIKPEEQLRSRKEIEPIANKDWLLHAMASLSSDAAGVGPEMAYFGSTSGHSIAYMMQSIEMVPPAPARGLAQLDSGFSNLATGEGEDSLDSFEKVRTTDRKTAELLFKTYLLHGQTRYPIVDVGRLLHILARGDVSNDRSDRCILNLVFAIGARFLQTSGVKKAYKAEDFYSTAMTELDFVLSLHNFDSIRVLLLLSVYCLRSPQGSGLWTSVGLAMRLCIEFGMHRRNPQQSASATDYELQKRLFWSCYSLDRQTSLILGRPFAISDRQIDAELPITMNDPATTTALAQDISTSPPNLASFIHMVRLRRIESKIFEEIYRVDEAAFTSEIQINSMIAELDQWRASSPLSHPDSQHIYESENHYELYYHKAIRLLVQSRILDSSYHDQWLKVCVRSCGQILQSYKRLHQNFAIGFTTMAVHSIFVAGITILYCLWVNRSLFGISTMNDIRACSTVLFIIAERRPSARKYRDAFETLATAVIDIIESDGVGSRPSLTGTPGATIDPVQYDLAPGESHMLAQMVGSARRQQQMPSRMMTIDQRSSAFASSAMPNIGVNMLWNDEMTGGEGFDMTGLLEGQSPWMSDSKESSILDQNWERMMGESKATGEDRIDCMFG